jgi:uncharacterized protein YaeQ
VARPATTKRFIIDLSHVDENVYQKLDLRLAQQPSETDAFMLTRLLAYALLTRDDEHSTLAFSKGGLTTPEDPAIARTSLDGRLLVWCEIGNPSIERLHKASKSCPEVVLVTHHDREHMQRVLGEATLHRKEHLAVWAIAPEFLAELADKMGERGGEFSLTISDGTLYVEAAGAALSTPLDRISTG